MQMGTSLLGLYMQTKLKKNGSSICCFNFCWRVSDNVVHLGAGAPLSAMDGVLVAVKDEIDCLPYQTTGKEKLIMEYEIHSSHCNFALSRSFVTDDRGHEVAGEGEAVRGGRGVRGAAAGLRRRPGRQDQHARARRRDQRHQPAPRLHQEPLRHRQGVGGLLRRVRRRGLRRPLPRRPRCRRRRCVSYSRSLSLSSLTVSVILRALLTELDCCCPA
jgi:hypothetical protein